MRGTARTGEQTREALLAAGTALFAERGYEGASIDRIARKARVNNALISYHFGGKRGLYDAILKATFAPAIERLQELRASPLPPEERLQAFIDQFVAIVSARPQLPSMLLREVLTGGRHLGELYFSFLLSMFGVVREIVEQGGRDRAFRRVDPLLTHLSIVGSLVFFLATAPARERWIASRRLPVRRPGTGDYVRHIKEMVLRGITVPPAGPPALREKR